MFNFIISPKFNSSNKELLEILENFEKKGQVLVKGKRNTIKTFQFEDLILNIKAFRVPKLINKVVYRYFRKSKAKRSFEFATILTNKGINTPAPIAYYEKFDKIGLSKSYYICEHIESDLTYKTLVEEECSDFDNILRQFTRFTYLMHEKGIEFLDHSPGNTLIKKNSNETYSFYLVDLNRMKFHESLSFHKRMKNFSRLTPRKDMIAIMSNEYSKISNIDEDKVFNEMWKQTQDFQFRFKRKKRIKKKLKFWKK